MKFVIFAAILITSSQLFAQDMSRTETYKEAYQNMNDGTRMYIGGCSTQEDYANQTFIVNKEIVEYFEPDMDEVADYNLRMKDVDPKLIAAVMPLAGWGDSLIETDDITLEKIESLIFPELELYRFNIGVGGGNGFYAVISKVGTHYEVLSHVFDGDVEFCDKKVWTK
jgi:hypothetical protein